LQKYAYGNPSKMTFNIIFSLMTLAAYLRYPQIKGLGDELLPEGSRVQLTRKRKGPDLKTSRPPLPEGKKSKVPPAALTIKANELSKQPRLPLSIPKEIAFPRKSRYDKGKNKVNQHLLEDPPLVGPFGPLRETDGGEKTTILDLLIATRPSREITVPVRENNPLVAQSLGTVEPLATEKTHEPYYAEAKAMEPSTSNEMDRGGASLLLPEFMDDEITRFPREGLTVDQILAEDLASTRPSISRTSKESIKFAGETINWVSDPFKAFEDLIPVNPTTDAVALSRMEAMNKMSHHLVDVSLSDLPFFLICCSYIGFETWGEKFHLTFLFS
jgi:hypothetical protein